MKYTQFIEMAIQKGFQKEDAIYLKMPHLERIEYWRRGNAVVLVEVLKNQYVIIYKESQNI